MTYTGPEPDWMREAKARTIAEVYAMLGIPNMKKDGMHSVAGPCPVCGGKDRFWINFAKNKYGCRGCQPKNGHQIGLVMHVRGIGFKDACHFIIGKTVSKMSPQEREKCRKQSEAAARKREQELEHDKSRRLETAKGIWASSGPLGEIAFRYLRSRGIDPSVADDQLRFHPGLKHPDGGTFPAVVARVSNADGEGVGIWRIFLKPDGSGKAPVGKTRLGLGNVAGGACRIGGVWPTIGLAEGLETSLAVRELVGGGWPVWACLSTSGLKSIVLPPEVECVHVYADADPPKSPKNGRTQWMPSPGLTAAQELKVRLEREGRKVTIQQPDLGRDWNDVLMAAKKVENAA